jgi:thioredoxin reductase (NADPH)
MTVSATAGIITFYGASWCLDCRRTKKFLGEQHVDYRWIDIDRDGRAAETVAKITNGSKAIPTLVLPGGQVLVEPSDQQLAEALGLPLQSQNSYNDLTIVGAGPTGLSAAIYTTREDIQTVLYERAIVGGLAGITDTIDNYPGFPDGVSGLDLAESMEKQARRFGADIQTGIEIQGIVDEGKYKKVTTSDGTHYSKSILVATGSDYRKLAVPGEKEYTSRGVHYCATCDGPLYRGKTIVVVGGGNSAMQESIFLTKFAAKIIMLVRGPELKGSEILIEKVKGIPGLEIHYGVSTTEIKGADGRVTSIEGINRSGKTVEFKTDAVFVFIGLVPNTQWLKGLVELDQSGFVVTDKTFQTSMKGVFAAGDVRSGSTLQIASAVGEGVTAALMIREYLKEEG